MRTFTLAALAFALFYCVAGGFALLWLTYSPDAHSHTAALAMLGTGVCIAVYMLAFVFVQPYRAPLLIISAKA